MLERNQQDYTLDDGAIGTIWRGKPQRGRKAHIYAIGTIWRGKPQRGRKAHIYAVVTLADGTVLDGPQRFATWADAERWMRGAAQEAQGA